MLQVRFVAPCLIVVSIDLGGSCCISKALLIHCISNGVSNTYRPESDLLAAFIKYTCTVLYFTNHLQCMRSECSRQLAQSYLQRKSTDAKLIMNKRTDNDKPTSMPVVSVKHSPHLSIPVRNIPVLRTIFPQFPGRRLILSNVEIPSSINITSPGTPS